jgi:hypothetical protein
MGFCFLKRFRQGAGFVGAVRISVFFLAGALVGCGGGSGATTSAEAEHIGKVGQLMSEFRSANSGKNPKNIEELKNWAVNKGKAEEGDFISTRDQQLYVIEPMAMMRDGAPPGIKMPAMKMPVILHEASGKNGMKFVIQGTGSLGSEMSEEGLKHLTQSPPTQR